jgi:hypothetical protein
MEIWLDPVDGHIEYMCGYGPAGGGTWMRLASFHMYNASGNNSTYNFQLTNNIVSDWGIEADVYADNPFNLLYAILPKNPINFTLYPGLPEAIDLYIDIMIDPDYGDPDSLNLTVDYSGVDLVGNGIDETELYPFYFEDNEYQWIHPSEVDPSFRYVIDSINDEMDI